MIRCIFQLTIVAYISAYTSRYINKPKLIVCAGGDEFFMIDDTKFYFQQLLGDKYLRWYITVLYLTSIWKKINKTDLRLIVLVICCTKSITSSCMLASCTRGNFKSISWNEILLRCIQDGTTSVRYSLSHEYCTATFAQHSTKTFNNIQCLHLSEDHMEDVQSC